MCVSTVYFLIVNKIIHIFFHVSFNELLFSALHSKYTALHWAAKHGDANVIKLIAGAYKVNPNIRSNVSIHCNFLQLFWTYI
ncbi:hypothetical protein TNCT_222701 [Trichonephila clavata]|uniref:Ankyrin repeat protein n=1 Tax=Trichonephila clavata TaxID=2740835 RepID=A0A8X6KTS3_TRICU|nr:hypothetical protein TNCT_222701 [Trichonephila clavata]